MPDPHLQAEAEEEAELREELQAGFDHQAAAQLLETLGDGHGEEDGDGRLLGREIYGLGAHKRKRSGGGGIGGGNDGGGSGKPSKRGNANTKSVGGKGLVPKPQGRAPRGMIWDGEPGQWVAKGSSFGNAQHKPVRGAPIAGPADPPSSSGATKTLRRSSRRSQVLFEEQQDDGNNADEDDEGDGDDGDDGDDNGDSDEDEDDEEDEADEEDARKGGGLSAYDNIDDDGSSSEEEDDDEADEKGFAEQEHRDDYFDQAKKRHKTSNKTLAKMEAAVMDQVGACAVCRCVVRVCYACGEWACCNDGDPLLKRARWVLPCLRANM